MNQDIDRKSPVSFALQLVFVSNQKTMSSGDNIQAFFAEFDRTLRLIEPTKTEQRKLLEHLRKVGPYIKFYDHLDPKLFLQM